MVWLVKLVNFNLTALGYVLKKYKHYSSFLSLLTLSLFLNGCSIAYKSTGDFLLDYAEEQGVPYMLATNDVALSCSMAESFTPFLLSFSRVTAPPDRLSILFYLMAGNCAEIKAWEEELRYLRAIRLKNAVEARDARIAQQRFLGLAAQRQLAGYHYLAVAIAEPGGECPEFDSEQDEFFWLIGLVDGIQAIMNDIASNGNAKVPLDIGAKVGRSAACLDNEKWWGAPDAIQAAIWMTMPGKHSADKDPVNILNQAIEIGNKQGISIAHVLAAQVFLGQGKMETVKQIIRNHAEMIVQTPDNKTYKILNEMSKLQMQAISDRLWTEATGARTPLGKMGKFWDDPTKPVETIDIEEIL